MGSGLLWYGQASGGQPLPRAPHSFLAPAGPFPHQCPAAYSLASVPARTPFTCLPHPQTVHSSRKGPQGLAQGRVQ